MILVIKFYLERKSAKRPSLCTCSSGGSRGVSIVSIETPFQLARLAAYLLRDIQLFYQITTLHREEDVHLGVALRWFAHPKALVQVQV